MSSRPIRLADLVLTVCTVLAAFGAASAQMTDSLDKHAPRSKIQTFEGRLFAFLADQQDPGTGLLESFVPHPELEPGFLAFLQGSRPSFTYDNALAAIAWLARDRPGDRARARDVLDGLLAIQTAGGALPDAVRVDTLGTVQPTASTGNQAWAMLALITGWEELGDVDWLLAAERIADHVLDPANQLLNPFGFGGYRIAPGATAVSTEHNLDLFVAFERLANHLPTSAALVDAATALDAAARARLFAESRFDPGSDVTFTGTDGGGVASNETVVPVDTHTWSVLALGRDKWIRGYQWALQPAPAGLWVESTACPWLGSIDDGLAIQGPSYSDADFDDVWFEGLGQVRTVARLLGDTATDITAGLVLERVQRNFAQGDGLGLPASCQQIDTGFGFSFFDALAVAPTAWSAYATRRVDPFWFESLDGRLASHPAAALPTVSLDVPAGSVYTCSGPLPCFFTVTGTSTDVFELGYDIYLLVEPTMPSAGGSIFTQATPATVAPDGTWSVTGQLGDGINPVNAGDAMRLVALVVTSAPTPVMSAVTLDTVPPMLTTSGRLDATVQ